MSRRFNILPKALSAAMAFAAAASLAPLAHADSTDRAGCFDAREWQAWKSPSDNVILLRVNASEVFRLDLSTGSNQLKYSDVHLVNNNRSTSRWVCSPQDLDLRVSDSHNTFTEGLIVKSITKLTPDEVAAFPAKFRP